jgi:phage terminase Nu1 subunit (DNA packaging protein)
VQSYVAYKTKDQKSTKASVDLDSAKLRKLNAQAEQEELRTDLMKGRVIRCVDAERTWGDFASACRSKLLSMPTKLARVLMGQKDLVFIATTIEDEIHQALAELKEFDIDDIQKFNPEFVLADSDRREDQEDGDLDGSQDDSGDSEDS